MTLLPFLPALLVAHIVLAVGLFVPSLVLPFALRGRSGTSGHGRFVSSLLWLQSNGSLLIGAGLTVTGAGLLLALGPSLLREPWLLLALTIYGVNLALAFFVQRPNLRRMLRLPSSSYDERERWKKRARRQRYVSYLMAAAVGLIGFLMSTKPRLW